MAFNEFYVHRVAFGNFTFPTNTSANTASTLSANVVGAYIPKGAIIRGIALFPGGALTNMSAMKDGTINFLVGGQAIGTNDRKCSEAIVQTVAATMAPAAAGMYVSVGGQLVANIASSDSDRSAIAADCDVYVEYLYCAENDTL